MPLKVVPTDSAKPVTLRLKLNYAVCNNLCVPAEASAQLDLSPTSSSADADLAAAEARVPKPAALGSGGPLAIRAVRREDGTGKPRIIVDVAAPKDGPVDLFVEGPTPEWALPLPEPKATAAAGLRQFSFELDGLPAGAKAHGAELTFTLVGGTGAIEVKTRLD
jgi:DsbC/DsbD-like thiol-disulfide interchange protein